MAAALVALLVAVVALYGERLAPNESIFFVVEHGADPRPYDPGLVFPLGSDVLGRDLLSLVLAGTGTTVTVVLLGGGARVGAGLLLAALGARWRGIRDLTDLGSDLVSAVPATLVALVVLKTLVKNSDASVGLFLSALLVTGWAGPYRLVRSELDRLARTPFTEGAMAVGLTPWRVLWRHHLPHLVPVLAINLSQQIVATLVLVAELGVLGAFVGATRVISVEESLTVVRTGPVNFAQIADPPEWGGLLASARTVESLWTTRWLILVPGVAFALLAGAVALTGFALARRYTRVDFIADVRRPAAAGFALVLALMWSGTALAPERFAEARAWADLVRGSLRADDTLAGALAGSGAHPLGTAGYEITRTSDIVQQTAPASASVAGVTVTEQWPRKVIRLPDRGLYAQALVTADTGGGVVDAPLVFAARGISQQDYPAQPGSAFRTTFSSAAQDLGYLIRNYADDYAGIDVRGKIVLLVRFVGVNPVGGAKPTTPMIAGPAPEVSIANAVKRGAAAVLFVDPLMRSYEPTYRGQGTLVDPYARLEQESPAVRTDGVPVFLLSSEAASLFLANVGLDLSPYLAADNAGAEHLSSGARDLGLNAHVGVPLTRVQGARATSLAARLASEPSAGEILVWARREPDARHPATAVLAALTRALQPRGTPMVVVDFDPSLNPQENAAAVREVLAREPITLVVVLDELDGSALRLTTPNGDLIPAFDLYAERSGARYQVTRGTASITDLAGIAPFIDRKTILIRGTGGDGDLRPDAAALLGYLVGRRALGAEELR